MQREDQLVLFSRELEQVDVSKLREELADAKFPKDKWNSIFLPYASSPQAPRDVPSIVLSSIDSTIRIQISSSKIEVFIASDQNLSDLKFDSVLEIANDILSLQELNSIKFDRIGLIVKGIITFKKPADKVSYLTGNFLSERAVEGLDTYNISLNFPTVLGGDQINRLVSIVPVMLANSDKKVDKVENSLIQFDINTDQDKKLEFTPDRVFSYITEIIEGTELSVFIGKYTDGR